MTAAQPGASSGTAAQSGASGTAASGTATVVEPLAASPQSCGVDGDGDGSSGEESPRPDGSSGVRRRRRRRRAQASGGGGVKEQIEERIESLRGAVEGQVRHLEERFVQGVMASSAELRRSAIMVSFSLVAEVLHSRSAPLRPRSLMVTMALAMVYVRGLQFEGNRGLLHHNADAAEPFEPFARVWITWPILFTLVYLTMVRYGPRLMEARQPVSKRLFEGMVVYYLYQTVFSAWLAIALVREVRAQGLAVAGNPWGGGAGSAVDDTAAAAAGASGDEESESSRRRFMGLLLWLFYNNKYVELVDTVFIILRKKFTRLSMLHVYQRVLLLWWGFLACRVSVVASSSARGGGDDRYLGALLHSCVHVCLSGHHLATLLRLPLPRVIVPRALAPALEPQSLLLALQLAHFGLGGAHALYSLYATSLPTVLALAQLFVSGNMLVIFLNFHYEETYRPPRPPPNDHLGLHKVVVTIRVRFELKSRELKSSRVRHGTVGHCRQTDDCPLRNSNVTATSCVSDSLYTRVCRGSSSRSTRRGGCTSTTLASPSSSRSASSCTTHWAAAARPSASRARRAARSSPRPWPAACPCRTWPTTSSRASPSARSTRRACSRASSTRSTSCCRPTRTSAARTGSASSSRACSRGRRSSWARSASAPAWLLLA